MFCKLSEAWLGAKGERKGAQLLERVATLHSERESNLGQETVVVTLGHKYLGD